MTSVLAPMFEHMAWADARVLDLLSRWDASHVPGVVRLMAHVAAAERIWLLRLRGEDSTACPIWPEWSLEQVKSTSAENARDFKTLLAQSSRDTAAQTAEYRNSQGVAFSTPATDILTHVALHGSYHRGQIAAALRASGVAPVNTDFITFVRERAAPSTA